MPDLKFDNVNGMNYNNLSKEQLISKLIELNRVNEALRTSCEKEVLELKEAKALWESIKTELTASEKRYRGLFENMAEGFAYCKMLYENGEAKDFIYLMVNESFGTLTGLKNVTDKYVSEVIPGIRKSDPALFNFFSRVALNGQPERHEMFVEAMEMWFSISVYSPEKQFFVAVFDVITQRKKAEVALANEQYLMDAIMDYLPDHIYFKDIESRFIRINKATAQFLGLNDPSEAVGKTDFDFFTSESAQQSYEDEQTIIRTGRMLSKNEKETHHDRPDTWVSTIKLPLRDKEGNIIGTFGISRDITENKLSEDEFRKLSLRQEAILASVPEIIMEVDNNKIYTWANRQGLEFFGKDVIGKEASFYFEGEQETYDMVQSLFNGIENIFYVESWQRRHDGEKRLLAWWCQVLKDNDGGVTGALSSARDITERKLAEEEIKMKKELLQTSNAEKDKFFSILAHDLRGPLSSFLGVTQILSEEIQNMTPEEIKEITVSMKDSATNIYGLLENLLEWSRLQRGVMDFIPETFNVKQKIASCIEVLSESARKKKIKINFSFPEKMEIYADLHMFESVIRNLLSNAIKFTPKGGKISLSVFNNDDNDPEVKISDTGIGMNTELMSKLFLIKEKTCRTGTEGEPCSGLGLMLCKEFVDKHNGTIRVESEEGKGSTFSFTIPGNRH